MKYMKKKTSLKKSAERISKVEKVKEVVDNTQRVVGEVDTITKTISDTLYIRDNVGITIPIHNKDLKKGTLRHIIKQSGLTTEEFLKLFRG